MAVHVEDFGVSASLGEPMMPAVVDWSRSSIGMEQRSNRTKGDGARETSL